MDIVEVSGKEIVEKFFDGLRGLHNSCEKMHASGFKDESFILICCYIDALASQIYRTGLSQKQFCSALIEYSDNEFFSQVHPKHLLEVLSELRSFRNILDTIESYLSASFGRFLSLESVRSDLTDISSNANQRKWITDNLHKGTVAAIAYQHVRSEGVHNFWARPLSFSETLYKNEASPDITFELMADAYLNIINNISVSCLRNEKLPWELEF